MYSTGGHSVPHKDTPRGADMLGTLVVCLPVPFDFGELEVPHGGVTKTFAWSNGRRSGPTSGELPWATFFGDVGHEGKKIWSGHRVSLTWLLRRGSGLPRTVREAPADPADLPANPRSPGGGVVEREGVADGRLHPGELLLGQLREEKALALGETSLVLHHALDEQPLSPVGHLAHGAEHPEVDAVVLQREDEVVERGVSVVVPPGILGADRPIWRLALDHSARGAHAGGVNEAQIGPPEARQQRGVPDGPRGRTIRIGPLHAARLRPWQNS